MDNQLIEMTVGEFNAAVAYAVAAARRERHDSIEMPRELTDKQADVALAATAKFLDIKGSQLTVNREKMKARYRALVKFIEAPGD